MRRGDPGWDSAYVRRLRQYFASRDRLRPAMHTGALTEGPSYSPPRALGPFEWEEGVEAWKHRKTPPGSLYALFAAVFPEADSEGPWIDWQWESLLAAAATGKGDAELARPLVYIYEMPGVFTDTGGTAWPHSTEYLFHRFLLESVHRTRDPEQADYFFVPVYASVRCAQSERGAVEAVEMIAAAQAHVEASAPFWGRNGGKDHVWLLSLEEGACAAAARLRDSVLIDHSGALYGSDNVCRTAHWHECWAPRDSERGAAGGSLASGTGNFGEYLNVGWHGTVVEHGGHPCFDPRKDIFIPPWKPEASTAGAPPKGKSRTRLFTFFGDMGHERPAWFSSGVRPRVAELWGGREDLGMHLFEAGHRDYEKILGESVFCGVFTGDAGWAGPVGDYVRHGCIPVHIHDLNVAPYEGALDLARYSLRVPEVNISNLPYLLAEVPQGRIAELQGGLHEVQGRFSYSGAAPGRGAAPGGFETVLEILLARRLKPR